jgi:heat shock protein HslJ
MRIFTSTPFLNTLLMASLSVFTFQMPLLAGGLPDAEQITGVNWKWQQTRYNNGQDIAPADPSVYVLTFNTDGTLNLQADCNRGVGKYSAEKNNITIEVTYTTRAMCPPESMGETFVKDLNAAAILFFSREGDLFLELQYDSGTMQFSR